MLFTAILVVQGAASHWTQVAGLYGSVREVGYKYNFARSSA